MSTTLDNLLRRNLNEVFGQRDAVKRRAAIEEIWSKDGVFVDHNGNHVGHDALDAAIVALHRRFPDFSFAERAPPQILPGAGRLAWGFGPANAAPKVTGLDVAFAKADKIDALYVFLDPVAA